jgi:3-phosphoglycerate kinase
MVLWDYLKNHNFLSEGLIAGGDTISIRNRCLLDKKNLQKIHLSTGGGVVLELLSGKKLEGLEFLN